MKQLPPGGEVISNQLPSEIAIAYRHCDGADTDPEIPASTDALGGVLGSVFGFRGADDPTRERGMALSPKHRPASIPAQPRVLALPPAGFALGRKSLKFNETGPAINNNKKITIRDFFAQQQLNFASCPSADQPRPIAPSAGLSIVPARSQGWYPLNRDAPKNNPQIPSFSALRKKNCYITVVFST